MKHSEAFEKIVAEVKPRIKEVTIDDVLSWQAAQEDFVFMDVREDHEWQQGRASGSIHLGRGILERDIEKVVEDKGKKVVLYCGGGYRSALAADNMQKMGYTNVLSMAGGIRAWRERNLPEEKE
ncbi:MAG: rhodanese-like domain-containing protein [Candidatus Obscuribacter sp.]|nr:rhodanese-like domain-containing protein [Candidatus Obscuribacter sp.]